MQIQQANTDSGHCSLSRREKFSGIVSEKNHVVKPENKETLSNRLGDLVSGLGVSESANTKNNKIVDIGTNTKSLNDPSVNRIFEQVLTVASNFLQAFRSLLTLAIDLLKEIVKNPGSVESPVTPPQDSVEVPPPVDSVPDVPKPGNEYPDMSAEWGSKAESFLVPGSDGLVSESQVQEAIVKFKVSRFGEDVSRAFDAEIKRSRQESSGMQTILKRSLSNLVSSNKLSESDAISIYSVSHRASQLDDRTGAVSAVRRDGAELKDAIRISSENLKKIASGEIEYVVRSIS
ncbi:MAG TPA: hypothetical protein PKA63_02875 [Oligoflexia bacterium]|nr:hypothetical protein [Oligoflexia bacterium]HMP47597.1 hypothetical protein [Oligoflexia bacterium]